QRVVVLARVAAVVERHVHVVVDHELDRAQRDRAVEVGRTADGIVERLHRLRGAAHAGTSGRVSKYSARRAARPSRRSTSIMKSKSSRPSPLASAERNSASTMP